MASVAVSRSRKQRIAVLFILAEVIRMFFEFHYFFLDEDFLGGTLAPARRASDSPMAIACLRLFTFLPDRPDFKVPCLRSCMARFTF